MEFDREWIENRIKLYKNRVEYRGNPLKENIAHLQALEEVLEHHTKNKKVDLSKLPLQYYVDDAGGEKRIASVYNWPSNFIYWPGGECPIPDGLEFEYIVRASSTYRSLTREASDHKWNHVCAGGDIIAYRLTGGVMEGWEL